MEKIIVTKASGEQVPFSVSKLKSSLKKSGAGSKAINEVVEDLKDLLYDGISTKIIYKKAFDLLKQKSTTYAARYKLKTAIFELGPTGYPFEKYLGEILKFNGYTVKVNTPVKGKCITHEVDVVAEKDNKKILIECKFHNERGDNSDVKVPLYVQARFDDIKNGSKGGGNDIQGWLVTNTRFTSDAEKYGGCVGLKLIGWDSPGKESLSQMIDKSGLYPITSLSTITNYEKQGILDRDIVLCRELGDNPEILADLAIPNVRAKRVMQELKGLY